MSHPGVPEAVTAELRRLSGGAAISASFQEGVVTLTGEAADEAGRRAIEQGLLQLPEVVDVHNFLRVPAPAAGELPERLAGLLEQQGVGIEDLAVEATEGDVILRGRAAGWFDRDAAERLAWSLPGVRAVSNQIELPPGAAVPEDERSPP